MFVNTFSKDYFVFLKKVERFFEKSLDKVYTICYNIRVNFGRLAQLGEHLPYKQRVTGSSPVLSTTIVSTLYFHERMAW